MKDAYDFILFYSLDGIIKVSPTKRRISCQCHTKLPQTSVGKRLYNHIQCMFFWKVWHHCLGALSVPSLIKLITYQGRHSHSGKLENWYSPLDSDYSLSQQKTKTQYLVLEFPKVARDVWDPVMVTSGAWLSSVEVRTYSILLW